MNYCIIDDEPIAHRIIEGYCDNLTSLNKVGNCYDAMEAIQLLKKETIDVIFLDIQMPELSGFDLLKTLQNHPKVIVTSAYKEFALEGYELNITDYLLKPFSFNRFLKAMNKVIDSPPQKSNNTPAIKTASFFLKGHKKMHQIHTPDILYIEAYGNYTKVYLTDEMILSHENISSLEDLLPKSDFIRVHKSFIVSTDKIKLIEGNRITIGEHVVPVGQTYKYQLKQLINKR